MKHYLLPKDGTFYKANLHTHTNCSDGQFSPAEVKEMYKSHGYSVVAYTDHDIMLTHTDLDDENFLALTSFELDLNNVSKMPYNWKKVYHLNLFSPVQKPKSNPFFYEPRVSQPNAKPLITDEMRKVSFPMTYGQHDVNELLSRANRAGFLATFNHPVWSLQNYTDYCGIKGLWGIEVCNHAATREGYPDTVQPLEDLNRLGERVLPIAADDSHGPGDYFGGWTMIKAKNLNYSSIFNAMKHGDIYASSGPEIHELWIENGIVHVECSPAVSIILSTEQRGAKVRWGDETPVTSADFNISNYMEKSVNLPLEESRPYFRITVTDEKGKHAWSRCYYLDEFDKRFV